MQFLCNSCFSVLKKLYVKHVDALSLLNDFRSRSASCSDSATSQSITLPSVSPFFHPSASSASSTSSESSESIPTELSESPDHHDDTSVLDHTTSHEHTGRKRHLKEKAVRLVMRSKYSAFCRLMTARSSAFNRQAIGPLTSVIRKELNNFKCAALRGPATVKKIKQLNWESITLKMQKGMPCTYGLVKSMFSAPK